MVILCQLLHETQHMCVCVCRSRIANEQVQILLVWNTMLQLSARSNILLCQSHTRDL